MSELPFIFLKPNSSLSFLTSLKTDEHISDLQDKRVDYFEFYFLRFSQICKIKGRDSDQGSSPAIRRSRRSGGDRSPFNPVIVLRGTTENELLLEETWLAHRDSSIFVRVSSEVPFTELEFFNFNCRTRFLSGVEVEVLKLGFESDGFSQNNLIIFQFLEEARRVFDKMPKRDFVSWSTLIRGYARWGCVDEAREVFELMTERNSVSWNAMIAAYVQSNRFHEAFTLFDRMRKEKVVLDKFVAASMLSACTGLGALEQGEWIHEYIKRSEIEVDSKLATRIIDMYCKCGCLDKAFEVFNGLSRKGISSWNCIIGGLAMHGKGEAAIELFNCHCSCCGHWFS